MYLLSLWMASSLVICWISSAEPTMSGSTLVVPESISWLRAAFISFVAQVFRSRAGETTTTTNREHLSPSLILPTMLSPQRISPRSYQHLIPTESRCLYNRSATLAFSSLAWQMKTSQCSGGHMLEANSNEPDIGANLRQDPRDLAECPLGFGLAG